VVPFFSQACLNKFSSPENTSRRFRLGALIDADKLRLVRVRQRTEPQAASKIRWIPGGQASK
jgi:hypothetical protein